jgi:hypothetical protein
MSESHIIKLAQIGVRLKLKMKSGLLCLMSDKPLINSVVIKVLDQCDAYFTS